MTTYASQQIYHRTSARRGKNEKNYDEMYVKWIPLVIPSFAVLMAALAYIIVGTLV
jgi:hypothetical protein